MISTNRSDDIFDFVDFLERAVGAKAALDRSGSASADIARFGDLARFPLPDLYVGYLREFGQNPGPIRFDDSNPRLLKLIEFYMEQADTGVRQVPERGVVIGSYGLAGDRALLYSAAAEHSAEEPTVVVSWSGDVDNTLALTFRNYLYHKAFLLRWRPPEGFFLYRKDDLIFSQVGQSAAELGFSPYWFSDDWQRCLERDDGASLVVVRTTDGMSLYGFGAGKSERDFLKKHLIQQIGFIE